MTSCSSVNNKPITGEAKDGDTKEQTASVVCTNLDRIEKRLDDISHTVNTLNTLLAPRMQNMIEMLRELRSNGKVPTLLPQAETRARNDKRKRDDNEEADVHNVTKAHEEASMNGRKMAEEESFGKLAALLDWTCDQAMENAEKKAKMESKDVNPIFKLTPMGPNMVQQTVDENKMEERRISQVKNGPFASLLEGKETLNILSPFAACVKGAEQPILVIKKQQELFNAMNDSWLQQCRRMFGEKHDRAVLDFLQNNKMYLTGSGFLFGFLGLELPHAGYMDMDLICNFKDYNSDKAVVEEKFIRPFLALVEGFRDYDDRKCEATAKEYHIDASIPYIVRLEGSYGHIDVMFAANSVKESIAQALGDWTRNAFSKEQFIITCPQSIRTRMSYSKIPSTLYSHWLVHLLKYQHRGFFVHKTAMEPKTLLKVENYINYQQVLNLRLTNDDKAYVECGSRERDYEIDLPETLKLSIGYTSDLF